MEYTGNKRPRAVLGDSRPIVWRLFDIVPRSFPGSTILRPWSGRRRRHSCLTLAAAEDAAPAPAGHSA